MQAAREREGRLLRREQVGERRHDAERHGEVALDPRRVDRHRLERALPAHAAGGRRVEGALDPLELGTRGVHLDDVRLQVGGRPRVERANPFGEAEAERELLVVAGSPHRHRDGRAVDADLERLLDGEAIRVDRAARQPPHRHA